MNDLKDFRPEEIAEWFPYLLSNNGQPNKVKDSNSFMINIRVYRAIN
jgi:hypothetical protein